MRLLVRTGWMACVVVWAVWAWAQADPTPWQQVAQSIRRSQLVQHCYTLADDALEGRLAGSRGSRAAANYIRKHLAGWKLLPAGEDGQYDQLFDQGYRNLLAVLPGTDPQLKHEYVLLGAHYDHVGYGSSRTSLGPLGYVHNGADDNASGVAVVLEVARVLAQAPRRPRRSILFAFWDAEELGLLGSLHWCQSPTVPLEQVKVVVNCDMLGRMSHGGLQVLGWRSSWNMRPLVVWNNCHLGLPLHFPWPIKRNSDHYPFFQQQIPYLMFHTGLHEDYHRPSDDADKLNYSAMIRIAQLVLLTTVDLAQREHLPRFRFRVYEDPEQRPRLSVRPRAKRLGLQWRAASQGPAVIRHVEPDSPAWQAGLRPGDQVVAFNGRPLQRPQQLRRWVLRARSQIRLQWKTPAGKTVERIITLRGQPVRVGISWRADPWNPQLALITQVLPGTPAHRAGLRVGDRIYAVQDQRLVRGEQLAQLLTGPGPFGLLVERQGRLQTVWVHPWSVVELDQDPTPEHSLPLIAPQPYALNKAA